MLATINVNTTDDELNTDSDCSLREAIQSANTDTAVDGCTAGSGADTIIVPAGTYTLAIAGKGEDANATGDLDISSDLTIQGVTSATTIITATGTFTDRIFHVTSGSANVILADVTIGGGNLTINATHGAGIYNNGTLTVTNCTVKDNQTTPVGTRGGGIYNSSSSSLTLINSTVSGNFSDSGAGVYNHQSASSMRVISSTIHNNQGGNFGAGVFTDGPLLIQGSVIRDNTGNDYGGGMFARYATAVIVIKDSVFSGNSAFTGGGIRIAEGGVRLTMTDTAILNNHSNNVGGGIYYQAGAVVSIIGSTLSGNTADANGGGIGGHTDSAGFTLVNSTVSGNSAEQHGGGIYARGVFTLSNVTVADNTADSDANNSGDGGGLYHQNGTLTISNTLVADNVDGSASNEAPDCSGTLTSGDYNLIEDTTGCTITGTLTNNITGTAPLLGPLADNGGDTWTHGLYLGSPALDAIPGPGYNGAPATDQRGVARPQGAAVDMGAFEGNIGAPPAADIIVNTTDDELNSDGDCSLREAIQSANTDTAVDGCTAGSGADTITLPAGTYILTIAGVDEDANATGDLDIITGTLTINGTGASPPIIDSNDADRIFHITNSGASATLNGLTIRDGYVATNRQGGGVRNDGTLVLNNCTVRDNTAGRGAGIYSTGPMTITNSTIHNNYAPGSGGAGVVGGVEQVGHTLYVANSTVSYNNSAYYAASGSLRSQGSTTVVINTTVNNNYKGGVYIYGGTYTLANTIVANNGGGDCLKWGGALFTSNGNNIVSDGTCSTLGLNGPGDLHNTNPNLGPLQNNGGDTETHALLSGSPAIDHVPVVSCTLSTDQRGVSRPQGIACDTGAFEYEPPKADATIVKSVDPSIAAPGDPITYTLTFSNAGGMLATGVVITDIVPLSVTNTSVISTGAVITPIGGIRYAWTVADLAPGTSGVITITGVLSDPLAAGTFTNTATITTTATESNTTNNSSSAGVTVSPAVTNNPPSFTSSPVTVATEDKPYTYTVTASDPDPGDVLAITAPVSPTWLALTDHGDGTAELAGTPGSADVGDHAVTLRVEDSGGLTGTQSFTITVSPAQVDCSGDDLRALLSGGGPTINLDGNCRYLITQKYHLNAVFDLWDKSNLTIDGHGATIERAADGPIARLFLFPFLQNFTLKNVTIKGMNADGAGAGIWLFGGSHITVENTLFLENQTSSHSGGVYVAGGATDVHIVNTVFADNQADGTVALVADGETVVENCTFFDSTGNPHGAIFAWRTLDIQNSIIANYEAAIVAGGGADNPVTEDYNLFSGNNQLYKIYNGGTTITGGGHSQSVYNIEQHFVDAANHNYRLKATSPAIDKGIPLSANADADGAPRPFGATQVDVGAYEFQGLGGPSLGINKETPYWSPPNTPFTCTLTVANNGLATAHSLRINDTLPAGVTFVGNASDGGSFNGSAVVWDIGDLPMGQEKTVRYEAQAVQSVTDTDYQVASTTDSDVSASGKPVDIRINNDLVADLDGFFPNPDGYSFHNFGGSQDNEVRTGDMYAQYGPGVCTAETGGDINTCVLNAASEAERASFARVGDGGHCNGFSVSSLKFFRGDVFVPKGYDEPSDFQPGAEDTFDLAYTDDIRNYIAHYHVSWFSSPIDPQGKVFRVTSSNSPKEVVEFLQTHDFDGPGDDDNYYLVINHGGHAVVPYALEDKGGDVYWLYIYEVNAPNDFNRKIEFDTNDNTWAYLPDGEPDALGIYLGSVDYKTNYYKHCHFCNPPTVGRAASALNADNYIEYTLTGEGQILVTNSAGQRVGYDPDTGEYVNEIPGAEIERFPLGMGLNIPPIIRVPAGDVYDIQVMNTDNAFGNTEAEADFYATSSGFVVGFEGLLIDSETVEPTLETHSLQSQASSALAAAFETMNLSFDDGNKTVSFQASANDSETPALVLAINDPAGGPGFIFKISGMGLAPGTKVDMSFDVETKKLTFSDNDDSQNNTYDLSIERINADGSIDTYEDTDVTSGTGDGATVDFSDWDGESPPPIDMVLVTATGTGNAVLQTSAGHFSAADGVGNPSPADAPLLDFPHGFFEFTIEGLTPGETVVITITLPGDMPTTTEYWKYGPTAANPADLWYQIPMGDNDGDNVITIEITDGGDGDDDLVANGAITEPGGPGQQPPLPQFILTVNKIETGGGSGRVTSNPAGINCGADCTEDYVKYTDVTLTAHPGVKTYLVGWSGDCDANGQVTMDSDKTCTATFGYPVGGIVVPVNKVGLLALRLSSGQAPWMGLAALAGLAALGVALVRKRKP